MLKELRHIEFYANGSILFDLEIDRQLLPVEVVVIGEVIDKARQFFFGVSIFPFESEEDVSGFPIPI